MHSRVRTCTLHTHTAHTRYGAQPQYEVATSQEVKVLPRLEGGHLAPSVGDLFAHMFELLN